MTKITNFVWNSVDDCIISEVDETGAVQAVYTNEPQQYGGVISQRRGTTSHYHHHDALGSTRFLTDSSGNVSDTYLNDAWGVPVASAGTTDNPFKWVGKYGYYTDNSTEQVYVRARMYQPTAARWRSVDPLGFLDGSNLYLIVGNRSAISVDPSGTVRWETVYVGDVPTGLPASLFSRLRNGLFAFRGPCGSYAWQVEWKSPDFGWGNEDRIIVQKVCFFRDYTACEGSELVEYSIPINGVRNNKPAKECPESCYFELWRVHDGEIYSRPIGRGAFNNRNRESTDTFAWLGFQNTTTKGCTKGKSTQTGWSFSIASSVFDHENLEKQFKSGDGGILEAGVLYSACATPELESRLLRASWTIPGHEPPPANLEFPLPTHDKRTVNAEWDCCALPCTGGPCNSTNPKNNIEFVPFPNSESKGAY